MKAIIFDIGGVCLNNYWSKEQRKDFSNKFSLDFDKMQEYHLIHLKMLILGKISENNYFKDLFEYLNKNIRVEDAISYIRSKSMAYQEVLDFVKELSKSYELYAFTNEIREGSEFRISNFKLNNYFKKIFVSSDIGFDKFDKESFLFIAKQINKEPKDIVFIDDNPDFVNKSQSTGIHAILFNNLNRLKSELKSIGIY